FIMEWMFNAVVFDGFDSSQCMLKEAKARYDQFFDEYGIPEVWWVKGRDKVIAEAVSQGAAAQPRPPVRLRWHFLEPLSYRFFSGIIQAAFPDVEVVFQP
ncbi:Tox-REase-5 domain-containing protein, partial [Massilia glaciei]